MKLLARYGLWGSVRLLLDWLHTRLFFPGARLVRRPVYMRGRSFMRLGRHLTTGAGLRLDAFPPGGNFRPCLEIGVNVEINDYVHIAAIKSVRIGNDVLIASKVFITDHDHGCYSGGVEQAAPEIPPRVRALHAVPVVIEDKVWIGESVSILPGTHIGHGAIIGANAVVKGYIPPNSIAVGAPARVIKRFDTGQGKWLPVE
jgi:lipopolysaccharide O-acetyltransferase